MSIGLQELEARVLSFNRNIVEPLGLPARRLGAELDDDNEDKDESERLVAEYVAMTDDTFHETRLEELEFM